MQKLITDKRKPFDESISKVEEAMLQAPGLLGHSFRIEPFGDEAWTMSAWSDRDSLYRFVFGPVHRQAMTDAAESAAEFVTVTREVPRNSLPISWATLDKWIEEEQTKQSTESSRPSLELNNASFKLRIAARSATQLVDGCAHFTPQHQPFGDR